MAPNALAKETVIRVIESEQIQKEYNDRLPIRTDFILRNVYSYLLKNPSGFQTLKPVNKDEEELIQDYISILDDFVCMYGEKIRNLCTPLSFNIEQISSELTAIFNTLFADGYHWSAIMAYFVFVAVYAQIFIEYQISEDAVNVVYECFCCLVKEKLKPWIDHHDSWGGAVYLKRDQRQVGWTKNLLRSTASVFGTLSQYTFFP